MVAYNISGANFAILYIKALFIAQHPPPEQLLYVPISAKNSKQ